MVREIQLNLPSSFSNEFVTTAARELAGCTRSDEVLFIMRIASLKKEVFFRFIPECFNLPRDSVRNSRGCGSVQKTPFLHPWIQFWSGIMSQPRDHHLFLQSNLFQFNSFLLDQIEDNWRRSICCHPSGKKTFLSPFRTVPPSPPVIIVVSEF